MYEINNTLIYILKAASPYVELKLWVKMAVTPIMLKASLATFNNSLAVFILNLAGARLMWDINHQDVS